MKKKGIKFYSLIISLFIFILSALLVFAANTGIVDVLINSNFNIQIYSPEAITYNFSVGSNYTIYLNVSSNGEVSAWWYDLIDLRHNRDVYKNISFTPNTTFNAVRWENQLNVYALDNGGNLFNKTVLFDVFVNNSSPQIGEINSSIYVCEGNYLAYLFEVTDIDEDILISDISPKNPFYVQFADYNNLSSFNYYVFSGFLRKTHVGEYEETVSFSDEDYVDSAIINISVIEINNAPMMKNIGVQTIWSQGENNSFDYKTLVSDVEDGNQDQGILKFNISFSGIKLFNISSNGVMNFTANSSYLGVYNISVCVNDTGIPNPSEYIGICGQNGSSITVCKNFSLTITNENRAPEILDYFPSNLSFSAGSEDILSFNVITKDADGTIPDAYWYVDDIFKEYDAGSLNNSFVYIFGCGVSGNHTIKVRITDGVLEDSMQWNLTINPTVCPQGVSEGGGGGGGGGGGKLYCQERWAWEEWPQCKNFKDSIGLGELSLEQEFLIKERCSLFNWEDDVCGYQIRTGQDLNLCNYNLTREGTIQECYYTKNPSCSDNIKNCHDDLCEVLTDCGGPCNACPSCSDGIKNQGEEEVDCGGPCFACEFPSNKGIRWGVYFFVIIFIIILLLIVKLFVDSYERKKKLEKAIAKRSSY
ncbi:MAG: hypothetical protein WCX73_02330 [Candidatus Pacearchaeota archaeon]